MAAKQEAGTSDNVTNLDDTVRRRILITRAMTWQCLFE
jgi:hypothetical protein